MCGFDRWHVVTVKRKSDSLYETSLYACSGCSVMFLNPGMAGEHTPARDFGGVRDSSTYGPSRLLSRTWLRDEPAPPAKDGRLGLL
jgi:hypothetical protein